MSEPRTSPLEPGQFRELFGEDAEAMTAEQARRQLCRHHGVAAMDDEIEAMANLGRSLGTGFEAVLVTVKDLIDEMEFPTASAIGELLDPGPTRRGVRGQSQVEKAVRRKALLADIQRQAWALTSPSPMGRAARRRRRREGPR